LIDLTKLSKLKNSFEMILLNLKPWDLRFIYELKKKKKSLLSRWNIIL